MSPHRHEGISDGAMLFVIAFMATVAAALWLWGGLAGALFGSGWPRVGVGQLLEIVIRLPSRLSHPASAWPPAARSRLPGALGVYGAFALLAFASAVLVGLAALAGARLQPASGARWARPGELRRLRLLRRSDHAGRLVLGRHGGRLLYAEHRHALVAFGPPQSGKSAGIAIPALLDWNGPAVASSIKTDLLAATMARRRALAEVHVFDPFGLAQTTSQTWSPLHAARTWDGALEVAWRLAAAAEVDRRSVEGGDFWALAAEQRLAPLLYTAAMTDAGMEAVIRWVYGQGTRELHEALMQISGEAEDGARLADAHAAYDAVRAFEAQADRTRTSIEATAQTLLRAYRFQRVMQSAASSEITADRVLDAGATLYLIGDAKASKLLRPLFLALLGEVVDRAYERATLAGGRLDSPLLLCLDEAGNIAPLPHLAEIASTAPSHNIQLVTIFHDLAQARSRYGQQAETVVNSHRARMLLPGVADLDTLRYFAALTGEEEARDRTHTTGAGGTSRSTARRRRPLIAPEALRQLPDGHALLLYGRLAPTRLRLRLWFEDGRLRTLAKGAP
ncbi:MAG: type IV secretory system conjugative DNA transfer family protein [Solirubrobacterales bacterium]|nr:type IV secretory system conjugative DNA transfer family protein [Solirubrobacterales bacterium]MBV9941747.1 type IV secretory system conjugative DNA transfer family protein [Solirubrobacterales bacterium]